MEIVVDDLLKEMLEKAGRHDLVDAGTVEVDPAELNSLEIECRKHHPAYSPEHVHAWAAFSIVARKRVPKSEQDSVGMQNVNGVSRVAMGVEAQTREFRALKGAFDKQHEAIGKCEAATVDLKETVIQTSQAVVTDTQINTKQIIEALGSQTEALLNQRTVHFQMEESSRMQGWYFQKMHYRWVWVWRIAVLITLLALCAISGHAQQPSSRINTIKFLDSAGDTIVTYAAPFSIQCLSSLTCTRNGSTLSIAASGGGGSGCTPGGSAGKLLYDDGAGGCSDATQFTYAGSTITGVAGTLNLTGMTLVTMRSKAGLTSSTNGDLGYDTTAKVWHAWQNGADKLSIVSTNLGVLGQAFLSGGDGSGTFADPIVSGPDAPGAAQTANPVAGLAGIDYTTDCSGGPCVQEAKVDDNGNISVSVTSSGLPSGAATAAKQDTGNTSLASIDGKITAVNTGAVVVASSALPTGAANQTKQDTGNTSLASIDGKITAVNTGAVVVASSALPTGAANQTKQDTGNTSVASIDSKTPALGQALAAASVPIVLTAAQITTLTPVAAITNYANETGGNLAAIKAKTDNIPALGQALAAASTPVVLTAAQITTLTPPAAITNYANETGGNLAAIKAKTDNIPALGQALAAASTPVVLTAAQITTLTPVAAITNYANETGGNLATIAGAVSSSVVQSNTKQVNGVTTLAGAGAVGTGAQRIAVGQDVTTIAGSAPGTAGSASSNVLTIQGITSMTPILATVSDGAGALNVIIDSGTTTVTQATGTNLHAVLDTTSTTAVTQATASNLHAAATLDAETTKVIGTVRNVGNVGAAFDAATGAAPPANAVLLGGVQSGATGGFLGGIPVCDTFVNVNIATNTTTLLITGVSGRHIRVCSYDLQNNAADNVGIISGTGATCGTGSAAIVGTTAATGYNFAANGGISKGSGIGTVMRTVATGDSICLITSAATQLSGTWSYTIY